MYGAGLRGDGDTGWASVGTVHVFSIAVYDIGGGGAVAFKFGRNILHPTSSIETLSATRAKLLKTSLYLFIRHR